MVEAIPCIDEVFDQIIDAVLNGQKLSGPPADGATRDVSLVAAAAVRAV